MPVNDFLTDLVFSEESSDEPFWNEIYKVAFPDMATAIANPGKSQSQFLGIDRLILLKSGKTITIDEKKRRAEYKDILLEYKSNSNKKENDGWMNKQLQIDYIAYAFFYSKKVYLLNWLSLRRVWLETGKEWSKKALQEVDGFKIIKAKNHGYETHSIAVPIDILMSKLKETMVIQL